MTEPEPTCQHVDCAEPATERIAGPSVVRGLDDMVMPYCDAHAAGILGDPMVFRGARRVTVIA